MPQRTGSADGQPGKSGGAPVFLMIASKFQSYFLPPAPFIRAVTYYRRGQFERRVQKKVRLSRAADGSKIRLAAK